MDDHHPVDHLLIIILSQTSNPFIPKHLPRDMDILLCSCHYSRCHQLSDQYRYTFIYVDSAISVLNVFASSIVLVGGWCYIDNTKDGGVWMQLFCDYLWCLFTWVFSLILYFKMFRSHSDISESSIIAQVRYYPVCL